MCVCHFVLLFSSVTGVCGSRLRCPACAAQWLTWEMGDSGQTGRGRWQRFCFDSCVEVGRSGWQGCKCQNTVLLGHIYSFPMTDHKGTLPGVRAGSDTSLTVRRAGFGQGCSALWDHVVVRCPARST